MDEAKEAYDGEVLQRLAPGVLIDGRLRFSRVVDIAQVLLVEFGHAADIDPTIRPGEQERTLSILTVLSLLHMGAEQQAVKTAALKWKAASTGAAWQLLLPAVVLAHSVLCFLSSERLMDARAVRRGMQRAAERGACAWMNRTFPAGLQRLADEQQQARVVNVQARPVEDEEQMRKKRKRSVEDDGQGIAAGWRPPPQQDREFSPSEHPSSAPSSSSSRPTCRVSASSTAPSGIAASADVSFDASDCVWTLRQLQWAQRYDHICMRLQHVDDQIHQPTTLGTSDVMEHFCLDIGSCRRPMSARCTKSAAHRRRTGSVRSRERARRRVGQEDALRWREADTAAQGGQSGFRPGRRLVGDGVGRPLSVHQHSSGHFHLEPDSGRDTPDLTERRADASEQKRTEWRAEGARMHAAVLALGAWRCDGQCGWGWGEWDPPEDDLVTSEELARGEDNEDNVYWSDSDGEQWGSHRMRREESDQTQDNAGERQSADDTATE